MPREQVREMMQYISHWCEMQICVITMSITVDTCNGVHLIYNTSTIKDKFLFNFTHIDGN